MSKIIIKEMRFDNFLSYGKSNVVNFTKSRVVQLIGANGAGKSSIATALEECLFNKNSKGLSKSELFNWEQEKKHYHLEVDFSRDGKEYTVIKDVKSTAKVTLLEDGEDISGHTSTQTYKLISEIFGCDFSTFTKIVYQSVGSSLDFLKSTDAKRKEFLVGLFDQELYKVTEAKVKEHIKDLELLASKISGSVAATSKMIQTVTADSQLVIPERVDVPEYDETQDAERVGELKAQATLASHQKAMIDRKIEADRRVRDAQELRDKLSITVEGVRKHSDEDMDSIKTDLSQKRYQLKDAESRMKTFGSQKENTTCRICGSHLDVSAAVQAYEIAQDDYTKANISVVSLNSMFSHMVDENQKWGKFGLAEVNLQKAIEQVTEYENVDTTVSTDISAINADILKLQGDIQRRKQELNAAKAANADSDKKQALKDAAADRLAELQQDLDYSSQELKELSEQVADLQIVAKSLKDIVGYKLEYNVKVFEDLINKYLSELTDGVFALTFELNATKLDVIIFNNGRQTSMASCSTGQQQRIQTATLLAIRSLLSAISKVDINLLFLDEVISYIDTQGIETLIEVLLKEPELNSFIVSHGHSHPMAEQITIEQDEDQVSRLVETA